MPFAGETKERFGRQYIYIDPDPESAAVTGTLGVWRLRVDDTNTPSPDNPGGNDTDLSITAIAAEAIEAGNLVYVNDSGQIELASAAALETSAVAGMAKNSASTGGPCTYTRNTVEEFYYSATVIDGAPGGLTPGQPYYLSTNPGKWTTTPDISTSGAVVRSCGIAAEISKMSIEIQSITAVI